MPVRDLATFESDGRKNICRTHANCRFNFSIRPARNKTAATAQVPAVLRRSAEIIAGDFHFMRQFMPDRIDGKIVLTNTVTPADVDELDGAASRR